MFRKREDSSPPQTRFQFVSFTACAYHEEHVPKKSEEKATDNSYSYARYGVLNWLKQFIKPKARPAQVPSVPDYELRYSNYRAVGLQALAQGRLKEAIDALGHAALFGANDPVANFDLGRALQLDGKTEAARQAYLRALDLNPKLLDVKNALLALPPQPLTRDDFYIGQRIKEHGASWTFKVLEIKRGGFGCVYVVVDEEFGIRWALKTFQTRFLWDDADRKRFEREAVTWLMLDRHPNIVSAKGLFLIEGLPCLWLDYHPYNLAEALWKRPLSTPIAMGFGLQFCDGMLYAHQKMGIVHSDIKPSNCLLTEDLSVLKITDFGLARTFAEAQERSLGLSNLDPEAKSQFTTVAGTPQYMAPEQFCPGAALDTRTDIYSFGIMFYEMLTKDLPPVGSLAHSHIVKRASSYNVPENLKQIILWCVQLDPGERPSDFGEIRNELAVEFERLERTPYPWQPNPKVFEMRPSDWNDKGIALRKMGYFREACACFERIPWTDDATQCLNYGGCLQMSGDFDSALLVTDQGLMIDPNKAALWSNKGTTLESLNRSEEARVCYERALEIEPQNDTLWMNLGASFADAGHHEAALNCYNRSLEINPRNFEAWSNKATTLGRLERNEEALACCAEGLAIHPRYHPLWLTKSIVFKKMMRFEDALISCNRGLEIDENDPHLQKAKASILRSISKSEP